MNRNSVALGHAPEARPWRVVILSRPGALQWGDEESALFGMTVWLSLDIRYGLVPEMWVKTKPPRNFTTGLTT